MIKWEQFAKRRKLKLQMFASMEYAEYKSWCATRKVEPVSELKFADSKPTIVTKSKASITDIVTEEKTLVQKAVTLHYLLADLKKLRKSQLVAICKKDKLDFDSGMTKKELIDFLLSLNNS